MKEKAFNISVAVLVAVALALTIFNYTNEDVLFAPEGPFEPPLSGMPRNLEAESYPNFIVYSDEDLGCSATLKADPELLKDSPYDFEGIYQKDSNGCPFRVGTWLIKHPVSGEKMFELEFSSKGGLINYKAYKYFVEYNPYIPPFLVITGDESVETYKFSSPLPQKYIIKPEILFDLVVGETFQNELGSFSLLHGGYYVALYEGKYLCYDKLISQHSRYLDIGSYTPEEKSKLNLLRHGMNKFSSDKNFYSEYFLDENCGKDLYIINYNHGNPM